jgi:hypothetical protein
MSKTYLLSGETLKTFGQGALGAMTFGAYHHFEEMILRHISSKFRIF